MVSTSSLLFSSAIPWDFFDFRLARIKNAKAAKKIAKAVKTPTAIPAIAPVLRPDEGDVDATVVIAACDAVVVATLVLGLPLDVDVDVDCAATDVEDEDEDEIGLRSSSTEGP